MDTPKRLFVVGDSSVFESLKDWLFVEHFELVTVPGGMEALSALRQGGLPHLVVLDLDLPDMEGLDLCRELQQYGDLPVVVLARHDAPGQAARVLQYADDYIRLPVDPDELVMRIRRILSRVKNFDYAGGQVIELCDFLKVDYVQRRVIVDGVERRLTPIEMALLQVLVRYDGQVVSAETLMERVWRNGQHFREPNVLRVHIHRLRSKLKRRTGDPIIRTERGVGYVFAGC